MENSETHSNFERMIELATKTFEAHNDPHQLDVDEQVIEQLRELHPATLTEKSDEKGPYIWLLCIPTTTELMKKFLDREIGERELLKLTPRGIKYDCLYLCSGLTLPEYRNKGITKELALKAIKTLLADHPVKTLFAWNFTLEGKHLGEKIAAELKLPLLIRK